MGIWERILLPINLCKICFLQQKVEHSCPFVIITEFRFLVVVGTAIALGAYFGKAQIT